MEIMKIAVLGAGAMGSLFGSLLSVKNDVWLVDVNRELICRISEKGVKVNEKDGTSAVFHPTALTDSSTVGKADLVIVFVKSMFSVQALENNASLIGSDTYLMTLQNGAGHEAELLRFADEDHVVIGSTQHNSSVVSTGEINHGGSGPTSIGLVKGDSSVLSVIAENFTSCGIDCTVSSNVLKQIWNKMFTNTAASSLTALFQMPLGFIVENPYAHYLMKCLVAEAVTVANSMKLDFDEATILKDVENVCRNAKNGYTSIYADIRDGRRTEVDTISGSVIAAAEKKGIDVPYHRFIVNAIHALESRLQPVQGGEAK